MTKETNHAHPIMNKIFTYYGEMKELETKEDLWKRAIRLQYEKTVSSLADEDDSFNPRAPFTLNGMVITEKPHVSYEYDPALKSDAKDLGLLPFIVKVPSRFEKLYDLEKFELGQDEYIKPIHKGIKRKTQEENDLAAQLLYEEVESLLIYPLDSLLDTFKGVQSKLKELKKKYAKDKELLHQALIADQAEVCEIGEQFYINKKGEKVKLFSEGSYFNISKNPMKYDTLSISTTSIKKNEYLSFSSLDEGSVYKVTNLLTEDTFFIEENESLSLQGVTIVLNGNIPYVNGAEVDILKPADMFVMNKNHYKKLLKAGGGAFQFTSILDGNDFLEMCDVSSEGIESLLTQGTIDKSFVEQYKHKVIDLEKDNIFEVLTEEAHIKRGEIFHEQKVQQGQIRRMNNEARMYE